MALKPWSKEVDPREDLKQGKPLDAAEFAVHLDQVRDKRAPDDYKLPDRFFDRTYLTQNLTEFAGEVVRRLSGEVTETSSIFNMTTQFGGGKTHALTLLYHLANGGAKAQAWRGVRSILEKARVATAPQATVGVFVGTEFDSLRGRGGDDGTPLRKTPWGELAWQLGKEKAFALVAEHDKQFIEPKGDVIRAFLPKDRPCLILMDEIINYVSTYRSKGYHNALYNFVQSLSETVRGEKNVVLVASIPKSETEYTADDEADQQRFKKMLDRLGKAVVMSGEGETSEIIRRRLFDWGGIPDAGKKAAAEFAHWILDHKQQIPSWFPLDSARETFEASYPFHPMVLSVFERKWRALPRFQQTRGILRLLALWVSKAYQEQCAGQNKDPLIGLGTAPLDDSFFRRAVFEQLGEDRLETAVTTDIIGKKESHATRLDSAADEAIRKARLHRKVATAIFFESNGGQAKAEATLTEVRLAVAEPDLDIGNVDTVLEALGDASYYLVLERNRYRFSFKENLNKRYADRRASIQPQKIEERMRAEIQKVFVTPGNGLQIVHFPEKSSEIPARPALTLAVLAPEQAQDAKRALQFVERMTQEYGNSSRTFKSALIWAVPDPASTILDDTRRVLAWEDIAEEADELALDDAQKRQLADSEKKAKRDLTETVWRAYKTLMLLGKDNKIEVKDLGLVHSSAYNGPLAGYIVFQLARDGVIEEQGISPQFLTRYWPPAFKEWSTKSVRDAFFASPQFPRLLNGDLLKQTVVRGVANSVIAYVGKAGAEYKPFHFGNQLNEADVELTDDMFIITKETAEAYQKAQKAPIPAPGVPAGGTAQPGGPGPGATGPQPPQPGTLWPEPQSGKAAKRLTWTGEVPAQKWMNFYTKFLSKFATGPGLRITVSVEAAPPEGVPPQKAEEIRTGLRELGLNDKVESGG